jgi:hypothetical protein
MGLSQEDVKRRMAECGVPVRGSGTISNLERAGRPVSKTLLDAYLIALNLRWADIYLMPVPDLELAEDATPDAA